MKPNEKITVAFFGTPHFAQIVLEKLLDSPYKPKLTITAPDAKSGRGNKLKETPVKQTAVKNNIKVFTPTNLKTESGPEVFDLAILVAYGKIIPRAVLEIPKYGFINIHPSVLPKYRGPTPVQNTILNGDEKTGVSIMLLDEQIDHGPVLTQTEMKIADDDTHQSLSEKLFTQGAETLLEIIPDFLAGKLTPKEQNHQEATFTSHIEKQDGYIKIDNPPKKEQFQKMVKAYFPWPNVWTKIDGKVIKFLPGDKIQPEGKLPMSAKEFKNGYPQLFSKLPASLLSE